MTDSRLPKLSVVIATPDWYDAIRKTVACLRTQTIRDQLEIVIVAPSAEAMNVDQRELKDFSSFRVVELGEVSSVSAANAAGIRHASAPVVALAEDHSFPEPEWAEALVAAHQEPWAAVGPVIRNANPRTLVSWADLFVAYAPWLDPAPAGPRDHLPGHNSSYKRAILMTYDADLENMMASESVLHWDLRRKGHVLYLESKAKTAHMNFSRLSSWIVSKFHSGRVFAAARGRRWPPLKRLLYGAGAPLIPLRRLQQILQDALRSRQPGGLIVRVLPLLVLGLAVSATGEMAGYFLGAGNSAEKLAGYEFRRTKHLADRDKELIPETSQPG